ncbi:MAG: hypothetical protein IJ220_05800 [Clostridia bacterium]|nr:hypothetical protein [Clostridia bacterium]
MEENQNHQKDFTQYYNELKEQERFIREEERNKKMMIKRKADLKKKGIICFLLILVSIFIIRPIIQSMREYKQDNATFNILAKMNYQFKGKFEVVSPKIDTQREITPNGLYQMKDQKGNIFNVYKKGSSIYTDYSSYLYKEYVLDYITKNDIQNIIYKEYTTKLNGGDYFRFDFGIELKEYHQLDLAIEKDIIPLMKYLERRCQKDFGNEAINFAVNIYLNEFQEKIYYYEYNYYDINYFKNKIKVKYITYLFDNDIIDKNVSTVEMQTYHRPDELVLFVNGSCSINSVNGIHFNNHAILHYDTMEYVVNIHNIIELMNCFNEIKYLPTEELYSFNYHGKIYYHNRHLFQKIKGNQIPSEWTIKMIEDFFDVTITYDYDNKTINIETK